VNGAPLTIEPAGPEHADRLARLFAEDASPCYCRYWHFSGDKNAWLERCANHPEQNEAELRDALARGSDEARGVVAIAPDGRVVGWMKVAPSGVVHKLYDQRLYRGLPVLSGDRSGVFAIGCALVHPDFRRRGVSRALVAGAVRFAPAWGARALEAFPRRVPEGAHDADRWMGPEESFVANGFRVVHEIGPYPILRREL
jgi:GNAT superfamily N-acetyltransferase